MLYIFAAGAVLFRLATLLVSRRNERRLKAEGAVELGAKNSLALALAHTAFYLSAIAEALITGRDRYDAVSLSGLVIYLFGAAMLVLVIRTLGRLWTVKLMIAPDHALVRHGPFRWVRHPNYYLNIIPELVGFALVLHAFGTLLVGLPLYLIPLVIRIRQEESAMSAKFVAY